MAYTESEARALVIAAGHRLVSSGLIARTWGNLSARLSDTQFVITPSGMAYETLRPEDLVVVNIADCSAVGDGKPSSEKGVHADAYRLRPEVNFVVHTHQDAASVVSMAERDLVLCEKFQIPGSTVLGPWVPCADYGMPSTKKLRESVAAAVEQNPRSTAVLMPFHGALCLGRDEEDAFAVSAALEAVSARVLEEALGPDPAADYLLRQPHRFPDSAENDCGSSVRRGSFFHLERQSGSGDFNLRGRHLTGAAAIHAAIYRRTGAACVKFVSDPEVTAISAAGRTLQAGLDDLAQIAGPTVRCARLWDRPEDIAHKLQGRCAVLLEGAGALCIGKTEDDAQAVASILKKGCLGEIYVSSLPERHALGGLDARIQRMVYETKYSKRKK